MPPLCMRGIDMLAITCIVLTISLSNPVNCQGTQSATTSTSILVDVRLSGGRTPFEGNVEIRRQSGGDWASVCDPYNQWDTTTARTVCRQLGYIDAMWTWRNSEFGNSALSARACRVSCPSTYYTSIGDCGIQWDDRGVLCYCQSNTVAVTCYFPGFIGRYIEGLNSNGIFHNSTTEDIPSGDVTVQKCISTCTDNDKEIAVLTNGGRCYCTHEDVDYWRFGEVIPGAFVHGYEYGNLKCYGDTGVVPYIQGCGGYYQLDVYNTTAFACGGYRVEQDGFLYSPNYPGPYTPYQQCIWTVTVQYGYMIHIDILMLEIITDDYLTVRDGEDITAPSLGIYSGHSSGISADTTGNIMWVLFYSNADSQDMGFVLNYRAVLRDTTLCSRPQSLPARIMTRSPLRTGDYYRGDTISFTCITGYNLIGVSLIICEADGQWSNSPPYCEDSFWYTTRRPRYHTTGTERILDQASTEHPSTLFTKQITAPTAVSALCSRPQSLSTRIMTASPSRTGDYYRGDTISFACIPGYNLIGVSLIICDANGQWSNSPPYCTYWFWYTTRRPWYYTTRTERILDQSSTAQPSTLSTKQIAAPTTVSEPCACTNDQLNAENTQEATGNISAGILIGAMLLSMLFGAILSLLAGYLIFKLRNYRISKKDDPKPIGNNIPEDDNYTSLNHKDISKDQYESLKLQQKPPSDPTYDSANREHTSRLRQPDDTSSYIELYPPVSLPKRMEIQSPTYEVYEKD